MIVFIVLVGCNHSESKLKNIGLKLKPLYQREMNSWIHQNSAGITYKNPPDNYPSHLITDEGWYKGKLSLRGDLKRHWVGANKSYRFKIKENSFHQLEEFDLLLAEDKVYEQELFAYQLGEKLGLLVPKAEFVNLSLNRRKLGHYLLIERFTTGSLEVRNLPKSDIIKEANAWLDVFFLEKNSLYKNIYRTRDGFNPLSLEPAIYRGTFSTAYSELAFSHFSHMLTEMRKNLSSPDKIQWEKYIDYDQAAGWTALLTFFGGHHASLGDNLRWYFHPFTQQFRPIPYDILPEGLAKDKCILSSFVNMNPWIHLWVKDKVFMEKLKEKLQLLSQDGFLENEWKNLLEEKHVEEITDAKPTLEKNLNRLMHNRRMIKKALSGEGCLI